MSDWSLWMTIIGAAVATYATRVGGYLVLARFTNLHPRVEAALNAVPAAVLTTIVAPSLLIGGPAELASLAVVGIAALRFGMLPVFIIGAATLIGLRTLGI